jgi:thioredoxin 1
MRLFLKMFSVMVLILAITGVPATGVQIPGVPDVPVNNMVTVVDLGAKFCVPCRMMAPILAELEEEYQGRAAVIFIDIREKKGIAKEFNVSTIPTQIFYDKSGQEVWRHVGFLDKETIKEKLDALLQK